MLICQGPVGCELALSSRTEVDSLTVYSVQLQTDQTTPLGVCRKLQLHALRIDVLKMGIAGHLQKVRALAARHSDSGLDANLLLQSAFSTERIQVHPVIPLPRNRSTRVFASKLCPDRIMQPQPVSEVKPSGLPNWLRSRTVRLIAAEARGSCDFGIGGKFERYVIHIRASKSSKKAVGQLPSSHASLV